MQPLFSPAGMQRLGEIVQPGLLCVFDFDGTLSPIVLQPDRARMPLPILQRVNLLATYAPVAILTGRSIADIRVRLGFEPGYLVGNHGLEGVPGAEERSAHFEQLCQSWKAVLATALQDRARFEPGIRIEDKQFSLSVHYRLVRDPPRAEAELRKLFKAVTPTAHVVDGKCVFSLMPTDDMDKGTAILQLLKFSGARQAIYVGDDVTDEAVFRLRRDDILSVMVERVPTSAAEFFLYERAQIVLLLEELIKRAQNAGLENWTLEDAVTHGGNGQGGARRV